uniref:Uncharacterized protein n=1 Tax=Cacopsylla melanoneura TaxID=428564 RepID=A0A8D9AY46_9HEMI
MSPFFSVLSRFHIHSSGAISTIRLINTMSPFFSVLSRFHSFFWCYFHCNNILSLFLDSSRSVISFHLSSHCFNGILPCILATYSSCHAYILVVCFSLVGLFFVLGYFCCGSLFLSILHSCVSSCD